MNPRFVPAVALSALLAAGCTTSPPKRAAGPERTPAVPAAPAVRPVAGGCAGTQVTRGGPPSWNPHPAGFTPGNTDGPWVVGRSNAITGYLYRDPLVAPPPRDGDLANKVLWFVRYPREDHPLRITARPLTGDRLPVSQRFAANSSPGEIYPTNLSVPRAGCWIFTLTWGKHSDTVGLDFSPRPRAPRS